ncbi:meteorin [Neodiprion pinetum]|uniref:meteorin-like protein n=1 Tax=Neodiprion fabricii TaxID=2872261 RepID=UPI001ED8C5A3|nr:meteorin-like protein [Neodiprion fabricii]XP_046468193.1 meteorin-like protein [Neodiprion pinetum]XP_046604217.1 meteorin-like protein [Neodiprion virginianus]
MIRSEPRWPSYAFVFAAAGFLLLHFRQTAVNAAPAATHLHPAAAAPPADQCDWVGSGGGGRGVRPVYLRCSRGAVSWRYPRGALRIVLQGGGGRSFRGCVKVSGPARVYLEAKGTLRPVYNPSDGKHEALHRCFHSRGPVAALYVEADEPPTVGRTRVKLQYDLEFSHLVDDEGECRPCSKEELSEAYCQSDLVARGTVRAVEKRPEIDAAELVLRVTKMLRRVDELADDNEVDTGDIYRKEVRIRVPSLCDARHGEGEFVIMAKKRLGDLTLVCAPRLEAWAEAVRELQSAPCVLKS